MKFPQHIILDLSRNFIKFSVELWFSKYIIEYLPQILAAKRLHFHKLFFFNNNFIKKTALTNNQKKFTIKYSKFFKIMNADAFVLNYIKTNFTKSEKMKRQYRLAKHWTMEFFSFLQNPRARYESRNLKRLLINFKLKNSLIFYKSSKVWSLFNIYFLKKEKIYTKLKYSRVPQYDIVSGGSAALLAGFFGFLICEKFGFELGDSGDFYYLFIYVVLLFFVLRIFLKLLDADGKIWYIWSFKWIVHFLQDFFFYLLNWRVK